MCVEQCRSFRKHLQCFCKMLVKLSIFTHTESAASLEVKSRMLYTLFKYQKQQQHFASLYSWQNIMEHIIIIRLYLNMLKGISIVLGLFAIGNFSIYSILLLFPIQKCLYPFFKFHQKDHLVAFVVMFNSCKVNQVWS